ncbi:hypothetical protein CPLU01_03653 [Colletotrichum plurivorum]|uniref:Uncharacterized protein n=1 Tax=Colletotrichum plurivorum TaxID=2175906 RepID=A0A8H6KT30_9PEZI|nr:hypothetical protein CPLU01_03653 [Colletotrichum plurivorum]
MKDCSHVSTSALLHLELQVSRSAATSKWGSACTSTHLWLVHLDGLDPAGLSVVPTDRDALEAIEGRKEEREVELRWATLARDEDEAGQLPLPEPGRNKKVRLGEPQESRQDHPDRTARGGSSVTRQNLEECEIVMSLGAATITWSMSNIHPVPYHNEAIARTDESFSIKSLKRLGPGTAAREGSPCLPGAGIHRDRRTVDNSVPSLGLQLISQCSP